MYSENCHVSTLSLFLWLYNQDWPIIKEVALHCKYLHSSPPPMLSLFLRGASVDSTLIKTQKDAKPTGLSLLK